MQFYRFLKMSRDGAEVTSAGRSFHKRAPATGKARRPIVGSLTTGTQRRTCKTEMLDMTCQKVVASGSAVER